VKGRNRFVQHRVTARAADLVETWRSLLVVAAVSGQRDCADMVRSAAGTHQLKTRPSRDTPQGQRKRQRGDCIITHGFTGV
jgi:hypothetical protein